MKLQVPIAQWACEDEVYSGGFHEVVVTPENAPLIAAAAAAGDVLLWEPSAEEELLLAGHVQSQEDGEAAYADAVASGEWHKANLAQFELDVENGDRVAELTSG